jgi:hypothetical protein
VPLDSLRALFLLLAALAVTAGCAIDSHADPASAEPSLAGGKADAVLPIYDRLRAMPAVPLTPKTLRFRAQTMGVDPQAGGLRVDVEKDRCELLFREESLYGGRDIMSVELRIAKPDIIVETAYGPRPFANPDTSERKLELSDAGTSFLTAGFDRDYTTVDGANVHVWYDAERRILSLIQTTTVVTHDLLVYDIEEEHVETFALALDDSATQVVAFRYTSSVDGDGRGVIDCHDFQAP